MSEFPSVREIVNPPERVSRRVYDLWEGSLNGLNAPDNETFMKDFAHEVEALSLDQREELAAFSQGMRLFEGYNPEIIDDMDRVRERQRNGGSVDIHPKYLKQRFEKLSQGIDPNSSEYENNDAVIQGLQVPPEVKAWMRDYFSHLLDTNFISRTENRLNDPSINRDRFVQSKIGPRRENWRKIQESSNPDTQVKKSWYRKWLSRLFTRSRD